MVIINLVFFIILLYYQVCLLPGFYIKQMRETIAITCTWGGRIPVKQSKATLTQTVSVLLIPSCFTSEVSTFQVQDYIANAVISIKYVLSNESDYKYIKLLHCLQFVDLHNDTHYCRNQLYFEFLSLNAWETPVVKSNAFTPLSRNLSK